MLSQAPFSIIFCTHTLSEQLPKVRKLRIYNYHTSPSLISNLQQFLITCLFTTVGTISSSKQLVLCIHNLFDDLVMLTVVNKKSYTTQNYHTFVKYNTLCLLTMACQKRNSFYKNINTMTVTCSTRINCVAHLLEIRRSYRISRLWHFYYVTISTVICNWTI